MRIRKWMPIAAAALLGAAGGRSRAGDEARAVPGRELLSRHETVAEFTGTQFHRCRGMTALCPHRCGHSGRMATFRIVSYTRYEKTREYGDPQAEHFSFMIENEQREPRVPPELRKTIETLRVGDPVRLCWNHEYVTANGVSAPERRVTLVEKSGTSATDAAVRAFFDDDAGEEK